MRKLIVLALVVSACGLNQYGPWVDANGRQMQGSEVIEFQGFAACDQQEVTFLWFFGDQYAKDPEGVLGALESPTDGESISFQVLDELPDTAVATGITHGSREIFVAADRDEYLYIRLPNGQVERWPRAEVFCEA